MHSVLILNGTYQPLSVVPARRALKLISENKAVALDASGRTCKTAAGVEIELPYVILLKYVVKQGKTRPAGFSRHGVLARDNHTCIYCKGAANTIDHVIPKDLGGQSTYDNCVASCQPCNSKKSNRTLAQMGWSINPQVFKTPSHYVAMLSKAGKDTERAEIWTNYMTMYDPRLKLV